VLVLVPACYVMSESTIDDPATDSAEAPVSLTSKSVEQPAEQVDIDCVVCLENLPRNSIPIGATYESIARIIPCKHCVHDDCLLRWVERANSCPLCRTLFNEVEVLPYVDGAVLRTYKVDDKTQSVPDEYYEPVNDDQPTAQGDISWECEVCLLSEDRNNLLCCEGCQKNVHTYCIGEPERNAANLWFCHQCDALRRVDRMRSNFNRAQAAWEAAWRHLDADLYIIPRETDRNSRMSRIGLSQRMNRRRQAAAVQTGDGPNAFEEPMAWMEQTSRPRTVFPHLQAKPMTEDERTSWKLMEASENLQDARRKRRRGSSTTSEDRLAERLGVSVSAPDKEERKFKRPRTKRDSEIVQQVVTNNGESSKTASIVTTVAGDHASPGGIFTSILDGIGRSTDVPIVSAAEIMDEGRDLSKTQPLSPEQSVGSPFIRPNSPSPSSPSSPPSSRPHSPMEGLRGRPVFSPSSPMLRTPAQSPVRPRAEKILHNGPSSPPASRTQSPTTRIRVTAPNVREDRPLKNRSTSVTKEDKETIVSMVSSALKPHYPQKISKDNYTEINKRVSRKLYSTLESMREKACDAGESDGEKNNEENIETKKLRELVETEVGLAVDAV